MNYDVVHCTGTLVTSNIVHSRAIVSLAKTSTTQKTPYGKAHSVSRTEKPRSAGTDAIRLSKIAGFIKPEPGQDG
jgi:hypothetical protein